MFKINTSELLLKLTAFAYKFRSITIAKCDRNHDTQPCSKHLHLNANATILNKKKGNATRDDGIYLFK